MIENSIIMELIADGVLWHYESYDYKAAVVELKQSQHQRLIYHNFNFVPDELIRKHLRWITGKIRHMKFDPDGMISKMYVGRSVKYAKGFFPQEVGKRVKPILNVNSDKFGLIQAGLAVDKKLI